MKRVGLLTSHASMNFGGLLQAYALKETIKGMGYDCEIINYKPQVHDIKKHPLQFVLQRKGFIKKSFFGVTHYNELRKRMVLISNFRKKYYNIEDSYVVTEEMLSEESKKYDALCVGSDQLWNLSQKDNENRVYMLDFDYSCPSISYGISFGDGLQIKKKEIQDSLPLIRRFRHISVREREGQTFLSENNINAELVLDPTLMVRSNFWNAFKRKEKLVENPYIFIYGFENANQKYVDLIEAARKASKKLNKQVINPIMTPDLSYAGFTNMPICGPIEFINLVENANLVITNSFHGTIFSCLFNIPFISIRSKLSGKDTRKTNLLHLLCMEDRNVYWEDEWNWNEIMNMDNSKVDNQLNELREKSRHYLENALQESFKYGKENDC